MIKPGAVQQQEGGLRFVEVRTAGGDEGVDAFYFKLHGSSLLREAKRLAEVVDDVGGGLDADRQSHQLLADLGGLELGGIHLLMGGAGGMNDQRLGVADIGEMAGHPQPLDEL